MRNNIGNDIYKAVNERTISVSLMVIYTAKEYVARKLRSPVNDLMDNVQHVVRDDIQENFHRHLVRKLQRENDALRNTIKKP